MYKEMLRHIDLKSNQWRMNETEAELAGWGAEAGWVVAPGCLKLSNSRLF